MKKNISLALFMFLSLINLNGQNLVPNSSFEEINDTIGGFTATNLIFMEKIKSWTTPNTASPDLITPDFEEKYITPPPPHSGSKMVGIQAQDDWSEYVGINLTKPLIPNRTYHVEYWIRKSYSISPTMNADRTMNKNFGILFSSDAIESSDAKMLIGTPQIYVDTPLVITYKEWVKISKYFTPKEKYDKLYLGQFQEAGEAAIAMMGYYVIDDVSVKELTDYGALDKDTELPVGSIVPLNHIHFKSGTTELNDKKSFSSLKDLATYLKSNPTIKIRVNGHTDSQGSDKSNLSLSKRRAKFIAKSIVQNGISKDRIEWKGFGEKIPIADNETEEGRSKNRRVECEVIQ